MEKSNIVETKTGKIQGYKEEGLEIFKGIPFAEPPIGKFVKGAPKELSENMMDAWISFAKIGNPNYGNIPDWPTYDAKTRGTMIFGEEFKVEKAHFDKERAAWDGLLEI